jgi:arabinan endo-1,5-alpha-L-arabinosidase
MNQRKWVSVGMLALLFGAVSCQPKTSSASVSSVPSSVSAEASSESVSTVVSSSVNYNRATYMNPVSVKKGTADYLGEIPDPSIVKGDDGYLYVFSTGRTCLRSEDGCNFTVYTNEVIPTPTWATEIYTDASGCGVWAPDVRKVGDKWIYYYAYAGWDKCVGIGYATADKISGPFTDQGKLFTYKDIGVSNAIDPCFMEEDGHQYMIFGSFANIYCVQLTDDGMGLEGGIDYQKGHKILIASTAYEGSYVFKKGDEYWIMLSAGTCCNGYESTYQVYAAHSSSLFGPYIDKKGAKMTDAGLHGSLVIWGGTGDGRLCTAPGHNSVYLDDAGDYWMYYHAYDDVDNFAVRHLFMDKILWDKDGFPYISTYKPSYQEELDGPAFLA